MNIILEKETKELVITEKSKEIIDLVNNLRQQPLYKNNVLLSNENKDKIIKYIVDIETYNKNVKSLANYKVSLNDIKLDLSSNIIKINKLKDKNEELQEELDEKNELLESANNKINQLEKKNWVLEDNLRQWKERFDKLVNFLRNKVCGLFVNKDRDVYNDMVNELYHKDFLSTNDYNKIHLKPVIKKEKDNYNEGKNKDDDFEL